MQPSAWISTTGVGAGVGGHGFAMGGVNGGKMYDSQNK